MSEPYRVVSALPTGTAFARYLMVKAAAQGDVYTELALADKFKDSPTVHATVELQTKAAVAAGTTTDATWAGPLAVYGIAGEALALLRGASIIGALESRMRRVPFRTKVARETGSGTGGAWIGEGLGDAGGGDRVRHAHAGSLQSRQDRRAVGRTPASSATRTRNGRCARR